MISRRKLMPTSVITACHNSALIKQQDIGWTSKVKFLQRLRFSQSCPDKAWCLPSLISHNHLWQSVAFCFFHLYETSWNSCTYYGNRQVNEFITDFLFMTIHLRHVENGDDTEQAYKFEHQVEVLQWVALRGGGSDLWWKCQNKIHHKKPEGHQRHKVVELVWAVHTQAQCDCHEV